MITLVVLAAITLGIKQCNTQPATVTSKQNSTAQRNTATETRGLNRNPSHINYSKHARCRMECRHIDEKEVQQILHDGKINYTKSELQGDDCHKKYAVEGYTKDDQRVRIIFAPCNTEVTVVTVIDLGKEWVCDCE